MDFYLMLLMMKTFYLSIATILISISTVAQNWSGTTPGNIFYNQGNVGIGIPNPNTPLEVLHRTRVRLSVDHPEKNVAGIVGINISGPTGAINWAIRGVYQYGNGVANNSRGGDLDIIKSLDGNTVLGTGKNSHPLGNVGIGIINPNTRLEVLHQMRVRLSVDQPEKNVAGIVPINISGATGAINWAIRGVYQYGNGVANNSPGGDLDIIKSWNGNTILGTKRDGSPLGNIGIGTTDPKNTLSVNGTIWAKEIKVSLADAADWVFENDYELRPLEEVENFVKANKHLPDIPSAEEFRKNDLNVAEMDNRLLQKVEELTLYLIDQHKENKAQRELIETQKAQIEQLLERVTLLENQ